MTSASAAGTAPVSGPPPHPSPAAPTVRTPAGRLLREVTQQLVEVQELLEREPRSQVLAQALERLSATREALSLLALERAAPSRGPVVTDRPSVVRRRELAPGRSSASATRAFCRETLTSWEVPAELAASAVDVASELVGNALRCSGAPVVLRLELREDGLLVSVWDDADGRPRLRPYRPGISERGIGLHLVEHLSSAWGWTDEQGGKWVWARLGPEAGPVLHRRPPGPRPHLGRWGETGEAAHPRRPAT